MKDCLHVVVVRRLRHKEKLELLAKSIRDEGLKATAKAYDARDEDTVGNLINDIESSIGPISVCLTSALTLN